MVTINLHSTQVKRMHTKAVGTIFAFKIVTQKFNSNCSTSHGKAKSTVGVPNNEPQNNETCSLHSPFLKHMEIMNSTNFLIYLQIS